MDCDVCRGACCEGPVHDTGERDEFIVAFLAVRGTGRCPQLTPDGRCGIYDTRPLMCQAYRVGGDDCRQTITERRSCLTLEDRDA